MRAFPPVGRQTAVVIVLEFWPDYGPGPLWTDDGKPVDPSSLGVGPGLVEKVAAWNAAYEENRVPIDGPGDSAWLRHGRQLLHEIRASLGNEYRVIVTEPWWDEDPN
jgi:hypothetical protein